MHPLLFTVPGTEFVVSAYGFCMGLALVAAWIATAVILFAATALYRYLGERTLAAFERLMGMLLVAISVQMFLDGVVKYLGSTAPV